MDESTTHAERESGCTCCGRRGVRERLRAGGPGRPVVVAVCPDCDLRPAELQGWLGELRA